MSKNMRLLLALAQRDWSQRDLADHAHVSVATINKLCNEHHVPTLRTAYKLSQALDRSFMALGWDIACPEQESGSERVERGEEDSHEDYTGPPMGGVGKITYKPDNDKLPYLEQPQGDSDEQG